MAYRRVSRLSSPLTAKAFTKRPFRAWFDPEKARFAIMPYRLADTWGQFRPSNIRSSVRQQICADSQKLVRNWPSLFRFKSILFSRLDSKSRQWAMQIVTIRAGGDVIALVSVLDLDNTSFSVAIYPEDRGNSPLNTGPKRSSNWDQYLTRHDQQCC